MPIHNTTIISTLLKQKTIDDGVECECGNLISKARYALGYNYCLVCGEKQAKQTKHTIVPMPKSNYIVITDTSLLKGLNSSHKGNK